MLVDRLAQELNTTPDEIERLLALNAVALYDEPTYQAFVKQLHGDVLEETVPQVRAAYDRGLPAIKARYKLSDTVMSGYTLANWILGFMMYPDRMRDMLDRHQNVPADVVAAALPDLLDLLDEAGVTQEWKQALVTFSLPLLARR